MAPNATDPTVSIEEARTRIEAIAPSLALVRLVRLGTGWDHDVWLANDDWVFRFPRNEAATRAIEVERALLPWLAPRVPLEIPVGRFFGDCVGQRLIRGTTLAESGLDRAAVIALAEPLADFVRALHALEPADAPVVLGSDPLGRFDVPARAGETATMLTELSLRGALTHDVTVRLRAALERCPSRPADSRDRIVHADLHPGNMIVDAQGALVGVIDWVDVHAGDLALDLATGFESLPHEAWDRFFARLDADPVDVARARWRAIDQLTRGLVGAYGRRIDWLVRMARAALTEIARA